MRIPEIQKFKCIRKHGKNFVKGNVYSLQDWEVKDEKNCLEAEDGSWVSMDIDELDKYFDVFNTCI